jgi:hypothetical protein
MERSGPGFFIPALKRTIEIESSRNAEALLPSAKAEGSHRVQYEVRSVVEWLTPARRIAGSPYPP